MPIKVLRVLGLIRDVFLYTITAAVMLFCLWQFCRCFIADYFSIPSYSMSPTIVRGDKVVVNKLLLGGRIYTNLNFSRKGQELEAFRMKGLRRVRHNDIVVFNFPHHDGRISFIINNVYCKRVLAIPGDSIWTENGFYRNSNYEACLGVESEQRRFASIPDSLLPHEVLNTYPFDDVHIPFTTKDMHPVYVPRRGDVVSITPYEAAYYQLILEWETGKRITWDWDRNQAYADARPYNHHRFQHNYYFMAGDNVIDSNDSRYWGLVPEEYIVGVVGYIYHKR
ncbi:MAG: signal peptidase I [Prevotella sp.]